MALAFRLLALRKIVSFIGLPIFPLLGLTVM